MISEKTIRQIRHLHRNISLWLLLWVFFVAFTGMALNHSQNLGLDDHKITSNLFLRAYGIIKPQLQGIKVNQDWLTTAGNQLYLNDIEVSYCDILKGAATINNELFAGCDNHILILDNNGNIIERMTPGFGLPTPIDHLGSCNNTPCVKSASMFFSLDSTTFTWHETTEKFVPTSPSLLPQTLSKALEIHNVPAEFTWERVVRNFHSGVFFGLGPWLMDIFAIALMIISITGIIIWYINRKNRKRYR